MKNLKDIISEKLVITKDTKEKDIDFYSCDKIINDWKEFNQLDKKIFDSNILSFIHPYIRKYPVYIWIYNEDDKIKDKELTDLIKQHRKYNIGDHVFQNLDTKSIAGDTSVAIVLMDKNINTTYNEIYLRSRNVTPIKQYIILQEK